MGEILQNTTFSKVVIGLKRNGSTWQWTFDGMEPPSASASLRTDMNREDFWDKEQPTPDDKNMLGSLPFQFDQQREPAKKRKYWPKFQMQSIGAMRRQRMNITNANGVAMFSANTVYSFLSS